jgi:hypothetical protein
LSKAITDLAADRCDLEAEHLFGRYALSVKRLRAFLDRLPGGHRPPTGPLTTAESDARDLRQETLAKDSQRIEHEQDETRDSRERESASD